MKGQYLAVESVLVVAMGLTLAIGTISIFGNYQDQVKDSTEQKDVETVQYKIKSAVYTMKGTDEGKVEMNIPEDVGGVDYNLILEEEMKLVTAQKQYVTPLHNLNEYKLQGSVKGGTVTLYKTGNQYTLRSS
ncbi:MAG: hypothetical protein BRC27_01795 [Nanohaloarchaea archaeon SW_10_44_10]|nr:MAG: hypothetical protein BRC27_01795 [Nanohaloarchaea archaeon SW_10_44_10]